MSDFVQLPNVQNTPRAFFGSNLFDLVLVELLASLRDIGVAERLVRKRR